MDTDELAQNTRENLQNAFEIARRNLTERANKQAAKNAKLRQHPVFQPGQEVGVGLQTAPRLGWTQPKTALALGAAERMLSCLVG